MSRGVFIEHLASCARQYPVVRQAPPERVLAVGLHESGLRPLAIHDNTTGLSLYPETLGQAVAMASSLRRAGHRIDAGVMQVSDANWAAYGLTVEGVFDARANICAGARILGEAYLIERRAACRYNTGRPDCANGYPESIDRALDDLRRATPPPGAGTTPPAPAALELEDERLAANSALAGIADIDRAEAQRLLDGIEEVLRRRPRTRGAPDVNAADQTAREVAPELLKEAGGDAVPTMQRARWSY